MRQIIYIFIIGLAGVFQYGCEEALEKTPDGQTTIDKVLNNYGRSKGLIDAAYGEVYQGRDQIAFVFNPIETLTDNAFWAATYNAYEWHNGTLSLSNPVVNWPWNSPSEQLWPDFWRGIRLANNAIKYLPQSTVITEQERTTWIAEARVLRCWYYMNLLEFYGPVPWIEEPFEPTFMGWNELTRPTYDEIASKIEQELLDVINSGILPDRQPSQEARRVDNGIAYAIRARILLYNASPLNNPGNDREKWQRAADAAQDVIDLPSYSLVPMSEYKRLFIGAFATPVTEIIWRAWADNSHINNSNGVNVGSYPHASINNIWNCGESPTQELVDAFEMSNGALPVTYDDDTHTSVTVTPGAAEMGYSEAPGGDPYANRDARFYINIVHNLTNYGVPYNCTEPYIIETFVGGRNGFNDIISQETQRSCTGYYSRKDKQVKYWGPGGSQGHEPTHWVFFRLAEFYLQKAEALCELGNLDGAMAALNVIRERALQPRIQDVPGFVSSQEFIRERIRNERRVEYCLEGQYRFVDQRRWKILNETNRFVTGMRITKDGEGKFHYERKKIRDYQSYTDKYLVMPIPLEDAKKMTGMLQPEAWR
ncbi:putative outer membrane starch-binding protein [Anseongella ginsenosidimutans]|uniref:Putative outer membrane starch-binding protein n=1 Tax=Anseongella ginsenosidimutans TaxID=496056 RepID=A0A4R3L1D3_9SPHI|nr:RagB/SusD family nutrient uptake outer membrane protein [Anseongella ginsenosidimutans]QEC51116.1 RagB/SusD family nutrient uptake outer membrane protein [Anseongella ginsenosidimutans]TCS90222.1 putative outer membrane starch-binding protein [Anseongella ginsenosidimutans]